MAKGQAIRARPPIFLCIYKMNMPLIPNSTPPINDINGMNELKPNKKSATGTVQVTAQAKKLLVPRSYTNVFFKNSPWVINAAKVVKKPTESATKNTPGPQKCLRPKSADSVVAFPEMLTTRKTNNTYATAGIKVPMTMIRFNNFLRPDSISSTSGINPTPHREKMIGP